MEPADAREQDLLTAASRSLQSQLQRHLQTNGVFRLVSTNETELPSTGKTLTLEPTIVGFRKGSRAVRFWVGLGAGMPAMVVRGRFAERGNEEPVCLFEMVAAGEDVGGYVFGEFMGDKGLQSADIVGLSKDFSDYMRKLASGETIRYKK